MFDEKKVLLQLKSTFVVIGILLMMNTIGLIVSGLYIKFQEFSFYMWAFITFMGWFLTILQFKKADIQIKFKK